MLQAVAMGSLADAIVSRCESLLEQEIEATSPEPSRERAQPPRGDVESDPLKNRVVFKNEPPITDPEPP